MKILAVGDPHGSMEKIRKLPTNADLILVSGDMGKADLARAFVFNNIERKKKGLAPLKKTKEQERKTYMEIYNSSIKVIKYLAKSAFFYIIFGNVELHNSEVKEIEKSIGMKLPYLYSEINKLKNVKIINNQLANFKGVKILGIEYFYDEMWAKTFKPGDRDSRERARKETSKVRKILNRNKKVDILLCHQPPYGVLDRVNAKFAPKEWQGKHAGSGAILDYIKKNSLRYVFCGHIHEGKGNKKIGKTEVYNLGVADYKLIEI